MLQYQNGSQELDICFKPVVNTVNYEPVKESQYIYAATSTSISDACTKCIKWLSDQTERLSRAYAYIVNDDDEVTQ